VLEIGVGHGYLLGQIGLRAECACVGIDVLASALAAARETQRTSARGLDLVQGSGFSLPFPDGTFDVVLSLGVIEHYSRETARRMLQEHARVCRPDGRVLVAVPSALDLLHTLLRSGQGRSYPYHPERSHSPWGLARELGGVGLEPIASEGYGPGWSLVEHRSTYWLAAALFKLGLLDRLFTLEDPRLCRWLGNMTLQVARKPRGPKPECA
jgi:SAM-dependent methyltransferase